MKAKVLSLDDVLEKSKKGTQEKIIQFFLENDNPPDSKVHAFAEKLGIEPDDFETMIYGILSNIINFPKIKPSQVDSKQLSMGRKVEMEHTSFPAVAEQIALSHLKEIPDYYDRLKKMEDEAKKAKGSK